MAMDNNGSGKEMTLKKVYELALTAIAFLSFGIFVLQVIMCITAVSKFEHDKKKNEKKKTNCSTVRVSVET